MILVLALRPAPCGALDPHDTSTPHGRPQHVRSIRGSDTREGAELGLEAGLTYDTTLPLQNKNKSKVLGML